MNKKCAILQSNYIPWKGYFDIINDVDIFVFYDDVQYTKNDWRNRNRIKSNNGLTWLTVPVLRTGNFGQKINETKIDNKLNWRKKHLSSLKQNYSKSPYFKEFEEFLNTVYVETYWEYLSELNTFLIKEICRFLKTDVVFRDVKDLGLTEMESTLRLVEVCKKVGASSYLSGPRGKNYMDEKLFEEAGIKLCYKKYDYPEYVQLHGPSFIHEVTILDLLFNTGIKDAPKYVWGSN